MKGKFEKDIEEQLSDFRLEPHTQVWEEVEAVLHPRRKRRVIAWWWFGAPIAVAAGIAIWFYTSQPLHNHPGNPVNNSAITNNLNAVSPATHASASTPLIINHNKTQNNSITILPPAATNTPAITRQRKKQHPGEATNSSEAATHTENANLADSAMADTLSRTAATTVTTAKDTSLTVKKTDTAITKKKQAPDSTSITRKAKSVSNPTHQWSVVTGGGLSLIKASTLFSANTNDAYYSVNTNSSTGYPTSTRSTPLPTPQTGFFLLGGIQYEHTLGKHWQGYAGLQYRYVQNNQQVDYDSLTYTYTLDNYYTRGNVATKHNYSHWLELPVHIGYIINPSAKNQVQLLFGASLAYTVVEKWLIIDNARKRYYYEPSLNSHLLVNASAGIAYSYRNLFQLAFRVEQSLTPVQNVTDKYYWQQFSIQVSTPLSTFKRKRTK